MENHRDFAAKLPRRTDDAVGDRSRESKLFPLSRSDRIEHKAHPTHSTRVATNTDAKSNENQTGTLRVLHNCPLWCNGVHEISSDLSVSHRSDVVPVPAVEKRLLGNGDTDIICTVDLALGLEEKEGETWVWISPEDDITRGLVLSAESGVRLARSLKKLLDGHLSATVPISRHLD